MPPGQVAPLRIAFAQAVAARVPSQAGSRRKPHARACGPGKPDLTRPAGMGTP